MKIEDIVTKVLSGQTEYFDVIHDKYFKEIFKYVYNKINNYEKTEDLVQEIFIHIYKQLRKFDASKSSFRTWIYRVATNFMINKLKSREYRNLSVDLDFEIKSDENVMESILEKEQMQKILFAMDKVLKDKALKIMQLHFFSNLTVKEISESLSIPDKTIYKTIKTSIDKIKKEVL